jgi:hypothetical protein
MNWLVSSRKYVKGYEAQKSHLWDRAVYKPGIHDQVGKKVGILGYGSIGRQSMFHPWSLVTSCKFHKTENTTLITDSCPRLTRLRYDGPRIHGYSTPNT